jgi:hypothetical protein
MDFNGTLQIIGGEAFLDPDPGQAVAVETLMMMSNLPLGGTPQDRIAAAPDYFRQVRQKDSGDALSVTATVEPFGLQQVLVVDR